MANCPSCGAPIDATATTCPYCGAVINVEPSIESVPPQLVEQQQTNSLLNEDKNSPGFNLLAFLFPIVGLVLWITWRKDYPKKAHGVGLWTAISFGVSILFQIILVVFLSNL